jgi:hypothetical protein
MRNGRHTVAGVVCMLVLLIAGSVAALVMVTTGGGSERRASGPVTLAVVPGGVFAVAQDGGRVVWGGCRGPVVWRGSRTVQLGATKECGGGAQWLAVAGKRVLWAEDWGGNNRDIRVFTASLSDPRRQRVGAYYETDFEDGLHFGGIAGAGKTLAYTTVPIARLDSSLYSDCVSLPVGCRTYYGRGQTVFMAADGRVSKRRGGGIAVAASQDSVALARVGDSKAGARYTGFRCRCGFTPDWSPDGKSLALAGGWASPGTSIFVQSAKGFQRVTTGGIAVDANPRWSPDGTRLAFDRDGSSIYVVTPGDAPRRLTTGYQPDWSPDGSRIVFARSDIFTMDSSGGSVRRLAGGENAASPRWSPDGSRIAFVRDGHIYTVPAAGGEARLYSTKARGVVDFDWSRSGDQLAFWGYSDLKVHILDAAKGVFKTIGPGMFPSWSRDGRLAYSEEQGAATRIVDGDGNLLERLVPPQPTAPDETIEVRRARGGGLVASFVLRGLVASFVLRGDARSLGLSKRFVAAAVQTGSKNYRIQIYSLPSGRLIRDVATSTRVNRQYPPLVAVSGSRVVYSDGRAIYSLDTGTGKRARLALAKVVPSALSISGSRIVWTENREGRNELLGFVRTVTIPSG